MKNQKEEQEKKKKTRLEQYKITTWKNANTNPSWDDLTRTTKHRKKAKAGGINNEKHPRVSSHYRSGGRTREQRRKQESGRKKTGPWVHARGATRNKGVTIPEHAETQILPCWDAAKLDKDRASHGRERREGGSNTGGQGVYNRAVFSVASKPYIDIQGVLSIVI